VAYTENMTSSTEVTAAQLREVVGRLRQAGHWRQGDSEILIVFDAGYDVTRLAHLLADLPVELLGRLRSDRVFCFPPPPRTPTTLGRPPRYGREFKLADPATQPEPDTLTHTDTTRYGTAEARAWNHLHPRLTHRGAWADHDGPLPLIEGSITNSRSTGYLVTAPPNRCGCTPPAPSSPNPR
jgi:hypothetical protein